LWNRWDIEHPTRRLHALCEPSVQKERAAERYRLAYGRNSDAYPTTPTLLWEEELFQVGLHEALCGLGEHLWATGQWGIGAEDSLLDLVLPNTRLHLGLHASRAPRPQWPLPAVSSDGLGDLPFLGDDDPQFAGWTRLALVERQYVSDPSRPYSRPIESVMLYTGAVAVPILAAIPSGAFPFTDRSVEDWWQIEKSSFTFPIRLPLGPIIGLTRVTDWLGDAIVLVPPLACQTHLNLMPPKYGEPMRWVDASGSDAIVLRTWRVLSSSAFEAEPVSCEGSDMIARPDVFRRLAHLYPAPLRELGVIWRRRIEGAQ